MHTNRRGWLGRLRSPPFLGEIFDRPPMNSALTLQTALATGRLRATIAAKKTYNRCLWNLWHLPLGLECGALTPLSLRGKARRKRRQITALQSILTPLRV
jgi:hypothetical protein